MNIKQLIILILLLVNICVSKKLLGDYTTATTTGTGYIAQAGYIPPNPIGAGYPVGKVYDSNYGIAATTGTGYIAQAGYIPPIGAGYPVGKVYDSNYGIGAGYPVGKIG